MTGEHFSMETIETTQRGFALGEAATGSIDPELRGLDNEILSHLEAEVLAGRFDVPVAEGMFLPCGCIDGRCPHADTAFNAVPNAAGGTLSLLVGEMLTNESNLAVTAETSEEALASLIQYLQTAGYGDQVGGHTGPTHGSEAASGCGANDQLGAILGQIAQKPAVMAATLKTLGVAVDEAKAFPAMIDKASAYVARPEYFATGKQVGATLQSASPNGNCPELIGGHNEVMIRLNTTEGTTLDRRALQEAYGDDYQVFNVDVWSLKKAAETLSSSTEEADDKFAAMVMYQVATALQLCGPSMRVVTS